ncbi:MAG: NUDIX domain-containing protein [Nanoarchaeota archaeon]|nr:NUDIX domain-containing protein [Nanoarchaeota archaeon]
MGMPKIAYSPKGLVHFSVGAIIKKGEKYLLIDRAKIPEGFACVAGHLESGETPEQAIIREVKEESGLEVRECKLLFEETFYGNVCSKGVQNHHWYVFECNVKGEEKKNGESKSIGWYSPEEIKQLKLEPSWDIILKKLEII